MTGPATVEAVKARLGITDNTDDGDLASIVAAVNEWVDGLPVAAGQDGSDAHPYAGTVELGAVFLAVRLFKRRDSPSGVEGFGTDGAVYVRRNDPDIGLLLRLGDYAKPAVG